MLSDRSIAVTVGLLLLACGFGAARAAEAGESAKKIDGAQLYRRQCAPCHGVSGKGDGPDATIFAAPPRDLREGFLQKYTSEELVRRVLDGRALDLALDPPALRAQAAAVDDLVAYLKRLPSIDWRAIEPGWELYVDRCEMCHGPAGQAGAMLPPGVKPPRDLADPAYQRSLTNDALTIAVRHGRKHMPALVPRLSQADAQSITKFVRLLSPGFALYERYCANCHGEEGRGVPAVGDAIRVPSVLFDRSYFAHRDSEQLRTAVWHMLAEQKPVMPHFRYGLTEAEATAIVEYLKTSEK